MNSPIERLIDNSGLRCTKCGTAKADCRCWIQLRCPTCRRTMFSERHESDPLVAITVETECPLCVGSNFSMVTYYDVNGNEVAQ